MKLKTITFALLATLLASSCMKEGDFSELKHPIIFEGDFDPVLGIPIAKISADVGDITDLLDTSGSASIYVDSNDLVSIRYSNRTHDVYECMAYKGGQKSVKGLSAVDDTLWLTHIITDTLEIPLFKKLHTQEAWDIYVNSMYFNMDSKIQGYASDNMQSAFNHGIKLYFDSITLDIVCKDGFSPVIPFIHTPCVVDETELMEGKRLTLLDQYDLASIVNRHPRFIYYSIHMRIAVPMSQEIIDDPIEYLNSLGIDSVSTDFHSYADFPLEVYCNNVAFVDTVELNMSFADFDSTLNEVERYLTLDTTSYIVIEAKNYIPLSVKINAKLLDSNMVALTNSLIQSDSIIPGSPVRPTEDYTMYESSGYTKSRVVIPIDMPLLHNLQKTRNMQYTVMMNTTTQDTHGDRPIVCVREYNKLELKAYIVVAPHIHLATDPVEIIK